MNCINSSACVNNLFYWKSIYIKLTEEEGQVMNIRNTLIIGKYSRELNIFALYRKQDWNWLIVKLISYVFYP